MKPLPPLVSEPPDDDSDDLTDEELENSIEALDQADLVKKLKAEMSSDEKAYRFERRFRSPHQYMRVRLDSGKTLLFQVDWLGQ